MTYSADPVADWDAHCDETDRAEKAAEEAIADCLRAARQLIARPAGLRSAINEAQANGLLDGETLTALVLPIDTKARWDGLVRFALEVMAGAIECEMHAHGRPKPQYADITSEQVIKAWSKHDCNALADHFAQHLGHCAGA